ncbi:uncharacterized protein N7458_005872 [Penicillium daleae]|uniref:F-box domain-containing protein n=1 Tax=Penicillium daleae TaxID=63821 RepID=A0AAD6C605_9EURO|nr:uncharacterized protein N7458_005872 [Penicillium daleae]KAJ5449423.1 hypothetical protein N7458_005872 [Penicillium daleae]
MSTIPGEVILQIVESLIPSTSRKIHPPSDIVTQTLISLTLACKPTYHPARQLLFRHCLYVDSIERLDNLFDKSGYFVDNDTNGTDQCIQAYSLFLAPFPPGKLDEPHIVHQIDRLFSHLRSSLRNLVINIPLRYLYPEDDVQGLRKTLRVAFSRLTALEDFCSVQDELFLNAVEEEIEPQIWPTWPRLRRLALYNPCVNGDFVENLLQCPNITHVVLTRADSYMDEPLPPSVAERLPLPGLKRVLVINTKEGRLRDAHIRDSTGRETSFWGRLLLAQCPEWNDWKEREVGALLVYADVPMPPGQGGDNIHLLQEWLCARAVDGTLWEFPGVHYTLDDA